MELSCLQLGLSELVHLHQISLLQDLLLYPSFTTTWMRSQMQEKHREIQLSPPLSSQPFPILLIGVNFLGLSLLKTSPRRNPMLLLPLCGKASLVK